MTEIESYQYQCNKDIVEQEYYKKRILYYIFLK